MRQTRSVRRSRFFLKLSTWSCALALTAFAAGSHAQSISTSGAVFPEPIDLANNNYPNNTILIAPASGQTGALTVGGGASLTGALFEYVLLLTGLALVGWKARQRNRQGR